MGTATTPGVEGHPEYTRNDTNLQYHDRSMVIRWPLPERASARPPRVGSRAEGMKEDESVWLDQRRMNNRNTYQNNIINEAKRLTAAPT